MARRHGGIGCFNRGPPQGRESARRTSERIIRGLTEYPTEHTQGGPIDSPEVVRCACRPKCACRAWVGEELGRVGGVRQGVLGLVQVDGRQRVVVVRDEQRRQGLVQGAPVDVQGSSSGTANRGFCKSDQRAEVLQRKSRESSAANATEAPLRASKLHAANMVHVPCSGQISCPTRSVW